MSSSRVVVIDQYWHASTEREATTTTGASQPWELRRELIAAVGAGKKLEQRSRVAVDHESLGGHASAPRVTVSVSYVDVLERVLVEPAYQLGSPGPLVASERLATAVAIAFVATGAVVVSRNIDTLIAEPQQREPRVVRDQVAVRCPTPFGVSRSCVRSRGTSAGLTVLGELRISIRRPVVHGAARKHSLVVSLNGHLGRQ